MDAATGGCEGNQINMLLHSVIIILLVLILWKLVSVEQMTTSYAGYGLPVQVYTSGATQRRLGQVFSSTDEGNSDYVSNDEIKDQGRLY